ncbi:hypothetical protein PAA26_02530 [Methanomassiliicoccaceae archaeon COG_1]|nr:hypothetical protein [Methanomassiliicoccaceae archaeon COG_1]
MSDWSSYADYFADGMPFGEVISTIFIIGLCTLGVIVARWMYNQL